MGMGDELPGSTQSGSQKVQGHSGSIRVTKHCIIALPADYCHGLQKVFYRAYRLAGDIVDPATQGLYLFIKADLPLLAEEEVKLQLFPVYMAVDIHYVIAYAGGRHAPCYMQYSLHAIYGFPLIPSGLVKINFTYPDTYRISI